MNRNAFLFATGMMACTASFVYSLAGALQTAEKAAFKRVDQDRLCVTIWTEKTRMQIDEPFDVDLRVVNATEKPLSFQIMSAGWADHWKSTNRRILRVGGVVQAAGNTPETITLEPGEAYEKHLKMAVQKGPPMVTVSFQLGFTPRGEKKTYWSNRVVLGIKPGKGK